MNRLIAQVAAAALVVTAAPAFAADAAPAMPIAKSAPTAKTQRYCFAEVQFGAVLRKNVCNTRAAWQRHGIDPLNFPN
jgi:hypothetical protein